MSTLNASRMALAVLSATCVHAAQAQGAAPPEGSDLQLFVTERLWGARWDHRLLDAVVTAPPTATSPPEVTVSLRQRTASKIVPIHSVGMRYRNWMASASAFSTDFDFDGFTSTGGSKRSEFDATVGYTVMPGVTASLIYKRGKVGSAVTARAAELLNLKGRQKGEALLLGLSAVAPLSSNLSLYGSGAYGEGKYQVAEEVLGNPKVTVRYAIADFGVAYRIESPGGTRAIDAVTLQLGYRTQVLSFRDTGIVVPTAGPVKVVAEGEGRPQASTDGLVLGVSVAF